MAIQKNTKMDFSNMTDFDLGNPYDLPIHNQGKENSCTAHAFSSMIEYKLSAHFDERTIVDVDDLWEKQRKFGTATEDGDFPDGPSKIAVRYGVGFKTDSGKSGRFFLSGYENNEGIMHSWVGWTVKYDS